MRKLSGVLAVLCSLVAAALVAPAPSDAVGTSTAATPSVTTGAVVGSRVIGRTVKGRKIVAYRLGDPASPMKVVLVGAIHGNEAQPSQTLLNLRDGAPIAGADIWVVPYLNRDGYVRHTRKNARGVDLNRNFPVRWIRQRGTYDSGPRPASEPETRAMMRFLRDVRPTYVLGLHQPLFGVDISYWKSRPLARRLSVNLGLPLKEFRCNNGCHGTMTQWYNRKFPGAALTVEFGRPMSWQDKYVTSPTGLLTSVGASR
jgi:murein peptide amidase A